MNTLSDDQKRCGICGTAMVPIGHEVIRTELVYTEPKLERIEYIATTYGCPECKDTVEPQFIKDEANELDPLKYLSFLLEHRPSADMSDDELASLAPWSEEASKVCK